MGFNTEMVIHDLDDDLGVHLSLGTLRNLQIFYKFSPGGGFSAQALALVWKSPAGPSLQEGAPRKGRGLWLMDGRRRMN